MDHYGLQANSIISIDSTKLILSTRRMISNVSFETFDTLGSEDNYIYSTWSFDMLSLFFHRSKSVSDIVIFWSGTLRHAHEPLRLKVKSVHNRPMQTTLRERMRVTAVTFEKRHLSVMQRYINDHDKFFMQTI